MMRQPGRPDLDNRRVFVALSGGTGLQGTNESRSRGGLSGTGTVMNAFLLPNPQKTVLSNAFRPPLKPLATMTNRTATTTLRRLASYLATDDVKRLPGAMAAALRA